MLRILSLITLLFFFSSTAFSQMTVQEEDGSPITYPYALKVTNGTLTDNGDGTASLSTGGGGGGAPTGATYITQTANGSLTNEQALGDLASGILKNTTTTGVLSIATAGTDYFSASSHVDHDATTNFVANEHLDWTSASVGTIHATNYVDNNTTYVSSDFTHDDLTGFVANEHIDWTGASAGTIHATNYVDNNTQLSQEQVEDFAGAMVATGGTKTGIAVTYQDATGDMDFVVDHDAATNFVANEHIDWTSASAGTIHATNYVDNDTTTNETITLSGDASGSGTSSIAVTIANDAIEESMLKAVNVAVDEDIVTYEATTGDFEYHTPSELITAGDNISWTGSTLNVTAHTTDTNANTICTGTTTYLDGEGNCDDISSVYEPAGITESDISDLNHTATAITDGLIVEADLNEDSGTPTDEDVLTYDSTGANFNWVAQSTLAAGTAAALAANGSNCSAGSYPLGVDASGAVESCTDATTEIDSAISTHAGNATAHQALVTLAGTPDYLTIVGQEITRGTIDIGDDTNLAGGTNITLSGDTLNVDDVFVLTAGDTMTGELVADDLGIEFTPGDTLTNCSSFSATGGGIFYDDSEGKFKKCQDNTLTDLDTTGSGISNVVEDTTPQLGGTLDAEDNIINDTNNIIIGGTSVGTSGDNVLGINIGTIPSTSPADMVQLYAEDVSAGLTADRVPDMTSMTAPSGTVSVSGTYSTGYGWNAVTDDGTTTQWLLGATSGWWQYDFGASNEKTIVGYSLMVNTTGRAPYDWTIEASNTGAYAGEEVVLDTVVSDTSWTTGVAKQYTFENSTAYRYWRIDITNSGGASGLTEIAELELFESSGTFAELKVRDEAGNATTLSPHNKSLIPEEKQEQVEQESDGLGWTYHSCKDDKCINVDMFSLVRLVEKLTGEQLIYSDNANINPVESVDVLAEIENLKKVKQDKQQQP